MPGSALLGRVLRRALRYERPGHRDEGSLLHAAVDHDIPALAEKVRYGAVVDDGDALAAADVLDAEAHTGRAVRLAGDAPDDLADERDAPGVARELARLQRRRAAAGESRVDEEDRKNPRDRERDDEPRRAPFAAHAAILAS